MSFRAGTVALIGRPNAGKSSLLNALVGEKIAAVSKRPQTTRVRMIGVYATDTMQAVLVDTPGIHAAWNPLNTAMVHAATSALAEVDVVCWIIDALGWKEDPELRAMLADSKKLVIALNKIDAIEKPALLPIMTALQDLGAPIVPISAKSKLGLDALTGEWASRLPEQEPLYPPDHVTDTLEREICSELIRERIFELAEQEVPYATAVEVEKFDESERDKGRVHIHARIIVEKPSQKAILIGKGGSMIKKIGTDARKQIETLLGCHVRLDLFVVVEKDWTRKPRMLKGLGLA